MPIPVPEPGLVISYAYVWDYEAQGGQDEGKKDRPCVIVLATRGRQDDGTLVTVLPITHRPPQEAGSAVELPHNLKRHLGLDDARSWVVVSEGDRFVWPGFDLRKRRGGNRYDYGFLPPNFFGAVLAALRTWHGKHKTTLTLR